MKLSVDLDQGEVSKMDVLSILAMLFAGGLVAWALRMIWDIHRGRQEGCASCKLYETPLGQPPKSLVCKTCGGFKVDPTRKKGDAVSD